MAHDEKTGAGAEIERCHMEMTYLIENAEYPYHHRNLVSCCTRSVSFGFMELGTDPCEMVIYEYGSEEAALAAGWICTSSSIYCPDHEEFVWMCPYCAVHEKPIDRVMPDDYVPDYVPDYQGPALSKFKASRFEERLYDDLVDSFGFGINSSSEAVTCYPTNDPLTYKKLMEQLRFYNQYLKGEI